MARSAIAATALASVACIATCAAAALAAPTAVSAPWIMSTVPPVPPDLDCTVRGLAYDYARHLMPAQGSFQSVYDALQLGPLGCNVSLAEPASRGDSSDTMASSTVLPSSQVFADPVHGNDANDGSITSPVRTLGAAVSRARAMPPPATVNLRSGTFYLHETVVLDAAHDSQLTIAAYNGEAVEVSGGVPITGLQWKPYNVTAKANTTVVQGLNNIDGQCGPGGNNSTIWAVGTTPDARGCAAKCDARSDCTSFTWHDGTNPDPWKLTCFLRTDGVWDPTPQAAHWSGFKAPAQNVWVADIAEHMERHYVGAGVDDRDEFTGSIGTGPDGAVKAFTGLRVNGQRGIRARYPNGDPETVMYPQGYTGESSTQWHKPVVRPTKATNVVIDSPNRTQMMTGYLSNWQVGVGGNCEGFWDPPASYWCMSDPPRGATYTARVPSGLTWANGTFGGRTWPNWRANESMLMAFRNGHWFSYGFLIDSYSPESRSLGWSYGGFQGAEGADNAGAWAVENVFDELDAPREWFVDAPTGKLYYFANTTAGTPPSADTLFVSTRLKTLLAVNGTQEAPVMGVTLRGITFTTAASTLLDPHGVPSDGAGDWALSRSAAVFIQGSLNTTVQGCTFERVDGNALMLSGFNREAWIVGNTFHWIGENAMVSWGNSRDVAGAPPGRLPFGMGMDGTGGDQPRGTHVVGNLCHEIGSFQKQVSCWFQAKTALTTLDGNVFFNGPRVRRARVDALWCGCCAWVAVRSFVFDVSHTRLSAIVIGLVDAVACCLHHVAGGYQLQRECAAARAGPMHVLQMSRSLTTHDPAAAVPGLVCM